MNEKNIYIHRQRNIKEIKNEPIRNHLYFLTLLISMSSYVFFLNSIIQELLFFVKHPHIINYFWTWSSWTMIEFDQCCFAFNAPITLFLIRFKASNHSLHGTSSKSISFGALMATNISKLKCVCVCVCVVVNERGRRVRAHTHTQVWYYSY